MATTEWTVTTTAGGISDPDTETSDDIITGWIEGFETIPDGNVDAGATGTLSEVNGLHDDIWSGTIGSATIRKYPVHEESNPNDSDPGSKRQFYVDQQQLKLALASTGSTPGQVRIIVKYIPDYR